MTPRPLGACGLSVSPVVFGGQSFVEGDRAERVRTLHAAIDAGITSVDTAPLYGFGRSEEVIGEAIADRRPRVQILGKVGLRWDDEHGDVLFEGRAPDGSPRVVRRDGRPRSVRRDVEQSLARLGIEALDLCQVHHPDERVPIADTVGELLRLRDEGKLRAIGVCNFSVAQVEQARRALGDVPLAGVQHEFSLLTREPARSLLPALREHGEGFLAYSPLANGLLAGRMAAGRRLPREDYRRYYPLFAPVNVAAIERVRTRGMEPLARHHGIDCAGLSLSWVLHQPGVTAVIVGASSPAQVRANARAAEVVLRPSECSELEAQWERVVLERENPWRRRDRLRERGERIAARVWTKAAERWPWLPSWPWDA